MINIIFWSINLQGNNNSFHVQTCQLGRTVEQIASSISNPSAELFTPRFFEPTSHRLKFLAFICSTTPLISKSSVKHTSMVHPSKLSLTLSADVLRLPHSSSTRLVLAEIVSLHAANRGCCDCSDAHLAARLTLNKDTVSVAVKLLSAEGLLIKVVDKRSGFYRTLTPNLVAIAARAATNPYPETPGSSMRKNRLPHQEIPGRATRKSGPSYPEIPGSPTRKNPSPLPGDSGTNTTANITNILQESSTFTADAVASGEKIKDKFSFFEAPLAAGTTRLAPHTGGASDVDTSIATFPYGLDPCRFPPELRLPFDSDAFRTAWATWRRYRAEIGKAFRGNISEQADLDKCGTLAAGSEATALKIISDTVSSNWRNLTLDNASHVRSTVTRTSRISGADSTQRNKIGNPSFANDVA